MSGFVITNQMVGSLQPLTTTYKTQLRLLQPASLMRRQRITEMEVSAVSVPNATDCQIQADLSMCDATGAGTPSNITPLAQDSGLAIGSPVDVAVTLGRGNYSAEPTAVTTAQNWWMRGFNQRSGVLWQASPGKEIIAPATLSVGPVQRALSTNYTGNVASRMIFDEL